MPWDSQVNPDLAPVAPTRQAQGPRLGFLEAFDAAWDAQMRTQSRDAVAYFFEKLDDEQADKARKAGKEYTPLSRQLDVPMNVERMGVKDEQGNEVPQWKPAYQLRQNYKAMADSIVFGEDNGWAEYMRKHDEHIAKLNAEDPSLNLKTTTQMFDEVRTSAQRAEQRNNLPTTWPGLAGSLTGGMVGAVDPRTDIFNTATLAVGGFGRTALTRIATQAGGQGAIEAVNQFTGVQSNRELLGLEHGTGNALWNIAGAAIGGAAIQGVGEGVVAGLRRWRTGKWFADSPTDPAPPQPEATGPVRTTPEFEAAWERIMRPEQRASTYAHPMGRPRAEADIDNVYRALSDWGGPRPWEISPTTATRPFEQPSYDFRFDVERGPASVDTIARRIDPEVFTTYDKLVQTREDLRSRLRDEGEIARIADTAAAASETRAQIAQLKSQLDVAEGKARKKIMQRIDDLEAEYNKVFNKVDTTTPDTPEAYRWQLQQSLLDTEKQMIDLRPSVNRAYARAQNKWDVYKGQHDQIAEMMRKGDAGIDGKPLVSPLPEEMPILRAPTTREQVPELARVQMQPGETAARAALRAHDEAKQAVEQALETFQTTVGKLSDMEHVKTERKALDGKIEAATEALKKPDLKGKDRKRAELQLKELQDQREALDTFKVTVDGKEHKLSLDGDEIHLPDDNGGTRVVTARQLLKEIEDDNNMLKAVTTCSLKGTS